VYSQWTQLMHTAIEIVTPAACLDLTVLETAKAELGIPTIDTSQDTIIATLIKQASGIVADYCDQVFGEETVTETFFADAPSEYARSFMLAREPVTAIVSVEIDGATLDPSEYRLAVDGHLHRIDSNSGVCQWVLTQQAVITYTAGYVLLDDLPYGIERAALLLIRESHASIGRDPRVRTEDIPGIRSVSYWIGATGPVGALPPDVMTLLKPYRRLAFA
jgi:hypothetical protein